jgi:tRNA(Ile)-lysidine synthase
MIYTEQTHVFLKKIEQTCHAFQMLEPKQSVLCAVSGGPDSVCLFHVCQYLIDKYDIHLAIAHVHHGLRGKNADRDADFVQRLAQNAGLPFYLEQVNVLSYQQKHRCSLEEAARDIRYQTLKSICTKFGYQSIALGHHADDNAEQIMMNIIRGTGSKGLSGIIPKRDFSRTNVIQIIRPLIHVYRNEIESFLKQIHQRWMIDETNDNVNFLRNRIRHHLIPILQTYNPGITISLNRLADIQRVDTHWHNTVAEKIFLDSLVHMDENQIVLNAHKLKKNHLSVVRSVFRIAIYRFKGNLRRISHKHIHKLSNWLVSSDKPRDMYLPDKVFVKIANSKLKITGSLEKIPSNIFQYQIYKPEKIEIPECNMILQLDLLPENFVISKNHEFSDNHVFFDADVVLFPLIIRNIEAGDQFQPFGMNGHQKIKKFFINQKVPRSKRSQTAVLLSQNKIVWVIGYRISQSASIDRSTKRVLECRCTIIK